LALKYIMKQNPKAFDSKRMKATQSLFVKYAADPQAQTREATCQAISTFILLPNVPDVAEILTSLTRLINDDSNDIRIVSLKAVKKFAKHDSEVIFHFSTFYILFNYLSILFSTHSFCFS